MTSPNPITTQQREIPWNADGIEYGGVYRLYIGGRLIAEYVPGNEWTDALRDAERSGRDVAYAWRPFGELDGLTLETMSNDALRRLANRIEKTIDTRNNDGAFA